MCAAHLVPSAPRGPVIAPPPQAPRRRKGGGGPVVIGVAVAVALVAAAVAAVLILGKGSHGKKGDKDATSEDEKRSPKATYQATAEPAIPSSAAEGRLDPRQIQRGEGRAVKPTATEVELASNINYAPDSDPYCKQQPGLSDFLKEVGYDIDQELRKSESLTDAEEEKIGDDAFREISRAKEFRGKIDTPNMAAHRRYITEVAVPMLASVTRKGIVYEFHTVDANVINAFAIPGGHIFFYRGILEQAKRVENEAQLAGIVAHEINHVDRRHTIAIFEYLKRLGGVDGAGEAGQVVVGMARHPFSTKQEDEADAYAVKFLMAADYSPKEFVTMWQAWDKLDKERPGSKDPIGSELDELFRTHSRPSRRACNAMKVAMANKDPVVERYYVGATNYKKKEARARQQY